MILRHCTTSLTKRSCISDAKYCSRQIHRVYPPRAPGSTPTLAGEHAYRLIRSELFDDSGQAFHCLLWRRSPGMPRIQADEVAELAARREHRARCDRNAELERLPIYRAVARRLSLRTLRPIQLSARMARVSRQKRSGNSLQRSLWAPVCRINSPAFRRSPATGAGAIAPRFLRPPPPL
jgi:hypothetical protein